MVNGFHTLIEALEAAPGDRPFITFWIDEDENETVTFAQFRRRAAAQAHLLASHGVRQKDRVIVIMQQGIAAMTTFVGTMMIGAVPAFLAYPNFKVEARKYREGLAGVTKNLEAKAVVIDREFPEALLNHVSVGRESQLVQAGDARKEVDQGSWSALISKGDLAFIQHSAGTTGLQKGVALTHAAVLQQLEHLAAAIEIDRAHDRIYSWLPLYHDMGLIACFMLPMVCHVPIVMQSPLDWVMHPGTALQIVQDHRCTLAWMPNFAFQFIPRRTRIADWSQYDLSSLRALINCSEPVRTSSLEEFRNAFMKLGLRPDALHSSYAMAENVFAVTQSPIHSGPVDIWADGQSFRSEHRVLPVEARAPSAISFTSSGRLLPGNEIRIVSDQGEDLEDSNVGEIWLKSDSLFAGYYNRPDLTHAVLEDRWYRTGDLGFCLHGELFVIGRKKDLMIVGGENLYPQDIEEIVAQHPAIHDGRALAMGIFNPALGTEEIVVVAEVENGALLANSVEIEAELRNRVIEGLGVAVKSFFLKPQKWIVKSTAGKAARSATREKLLREHPTLNGEMWETSFA